LTSDLTDFNNDVAKALPGIDRPRLSADLDKAFPKGFKPDPKQELAGVMPPYFQKRGVTQVALQELLRSVVAMVKRQGNVGINDKRSEKLTDRFVVCTTFSFSGTQKNLWRDYGRLMLFAIKESYVLQDYRPQLLDGVAGHIRHRLNAILTLCAKQEKILHGNAKESTLRRTYTWIDGLTIDAKELEPIVQTSAEDRARSRESAEMYSKDEKEIQRFVRLIENLDVSRLSPGPKGKTEVAEEVTLALDALIQVRFYHRNLLIRSQFHDRPGFSIPPDVDNELSIQTIGLSIQTIQHRCISADTHRKLMITPWT
jgi:hypothetical protein